MRDQRVYLVLLDYMKLAIVTDSYYRAFAIFYSILKFFNYKLVISTESSGEDYKSSRRLSSFFKIKFVVI